MKNKCKCNCKNVETEQESLEAILSCPILTTDEKIVLANARRIRIKTDDFIRKYGVKTA